MSTPRRGRPTRSSRAATERIEIRVTRLERAEWQAAAERAGLTLSAWIRERCTWVASLDAPGPDCKMEFPR